MSEENLRQSEFGDQSLGLNRDIHRRDFLNGVGIGIGSMLAPDLAMAFQGETVPEQSPVPSVGHEAPVSSPFTKNSRDVPPADCRSSIPQPLKNLGKPLSETATDSSARRTTLTDKGKTKHSGDWSKPGTSLRHWSTA